MRRTFRWVDTTRDHRRQGPRKQHVQRPIPVEVRLEARPRRYKTAPRTHEDVQGIVVFFKENSKEPDREFGFIHVYSVQGTWHSGDIFVHGSDVEVFRTPKLQRGDQVQLDIVQDPVDGKIRAVNVRLI